MARTLRREDLQVLRAGPLAASGAQIPGALFALLRPIRLKNHLYLYRYALGTALRMFGWRQPVAMCPTCGREDTFLAAGQPPRYGARCPHCGSAERHRLLALIANREKLFDRKSVLHFAPEKCISDLIAHAASEYLTADRDPTKASVVLDIEKIEQPTEQWDVVVASHILEHVDDGRAISELYRVLRTGGVLVVMVPIIEGWDVSYENETIVDPESRDIHFGQMDHVRYYGRDFRSRLKAAGFDVVEHTAFGEECVRYGLLRGEKVFVCTKPR